MRIMLHEGIHALARVIQGSSNLIGIEDLSGFTEVDWLYQLDHNPNDEGIASRCDKWLSFNVDDLCTLLCRHPQLGKHCPDSVWSRFKGGHWAKLVMAGKSFRSFVGNDDGVYSFFVDKMMSLGLARTTVRRSFSS